MQMKKCNFIIALVQNEVKMKETKKFVIKSSCNCNENDSWCL